MYIVVRRFVKQVSYKESEEETTAQVQSNDLQQGRKRKLKAMEDEGSLNKVVCAFNASKILSLLSWQNKQCLSYQALSGFLRRHTD